MTCLVVRHSVIRKLERGKKESNQGHVQLCYMEHVDVTVSQILAMAPWPESEHPQIEQKHLESPTWVFTYPVLCFMLTLSKQLKRNGLNTPGSAAFQHFGDR